MKRSGFKRPTLEEVKKKQKTKKPVVKKRRKKTDRKKLEERIWELCKQITRKRYINPDGTWSCYTLGTRMSNPQDVHTGHGKPKGVLSLRFQYDLRNLRPQSYHANINLGGMQDIFVARLEREKEGLEFLKESCYKEEGEWRVKYIPPMGSLEAFEFLTALEEKYKKILASL